MRRTLLSIAALALSLSASAQPPNIWQGIPLDSAVISFCDTVSSRNTGIGFVLDTSHTALWRSGSSSKAFFSGAPGVKYGIMTDTASPYPTDQSEWFSVKMTTSSMNPIFSFRHRYQTDSSKDGGIVEYSFDSTDWSNVIGGCFTRVLVDSFYKAADTITGGKPAFSGTSGWKTSSFQFFRGIPLKETGVCQVSFPIWVRWRFRSDSHSESLAGWQIQWIKVESDKYNGGVAGGGTAQGLMVSPNPSTDGIFSFPELPAEDLIRIQVYDVAGRVIADLPYRHKLDLSGLQPGSYYYQAGPWRGRLVRQ